MELDGQPQVLAALLLAEEALVYTDYEAGWVSESIWTFRRT